MNSSLRCGRFILGLSLVLALLVLPGTTAFGATVVLSGNWSDPTIWGGVLPGVEEDVTIPAGLTVTLNTNVECGGITVEGRLQVERANRTLLCDTLLVQGPIAVFEVGTATNRFQQNFTLTLKGLSNEIALGAMGAKVLGAHNGGTLHIHGQGRIEWTHLGSNAAAGATSLTLAEPVDWAVGDSILVTSSRESWSEAETVTITSVSGNMRTVFFATPLAYLHSGSTITRTRSTDGKSWTGDLRAEVGLLSRNVKIQGDAASETSGFGGHIMVMNGGAGCCVTSGKAFIEGVELYRMGQKSVLARYPMHWHMVADGGVGQYFRDSVVRHSFNRAITIHGTESTLVENNFCYDHLGHGIFLEDGSERFNVIGRNVVLGTKRPAVGEEILETDNRFDTVQNRTPASYWITNPNNIITNNVAAGTVGTGFWFAFPQKPLNASLNHPRFVGLEPYKEPLGAFNGNTAHSCISGLDINDQISSSDTLVINGEWANNGPFYFDNCTWYANDVAVYAGIGGQRKNVVYRNQVFADNEINLFLATYQLCEESLMVADSGLGLQPSGTTRTVYAVYDGAGRMKKNHLVGYNASNARFLQNIGAAIKHPNHYFESLTFEPPVPVRSVLTNYKIVPPPDVGANDPGHPRIWAQVIVDVDGSISGVTNSSIISNHPWLRTGDETRPSVWDNMYRSNHRFAQCRLEYGIAFGSIPNVSAVRTKPGTPTAGVYYINGYNEWHQLPLIVREDFLYTYYYEAVPSTRMVYVNLDDAEPGDNYLVRFKEFGKLPGISATGMTSQPSLAALKAAATSGFYKESNGDFYIRPVATATKHSYTISWTSDIVLPVWDSDSDGVSDGAEAAAGTDPFQAVNGTDPFVNSEFNVPGNFEEWDSFSGITNETVAGGVLSGQSTTSDSQMGESNLRVSGTAVPYLLARMKASKTGHAQFFWTRLADSGFSAARSVTANFTASNQWRVLVFPMPANTNWLGQIITRLRFDPVNTSGTSFEIDSIIGSDGQLITGLTNRATYIGMPTGPIPFGLTVNLDGDSTFSLIAASSNPTLVPNGNIVLAGTGTNRTVSLTPAPGQSGVTTITLTAGNGTFASTNRFTLTTVNNPPSSCVLTSPTNGQTVLLPSAPTLTATASDPENNLVRVSFYANGVNLGDATNAPYSFVWSNAVAGAHALFALARDAGGLQRTSAVANVTLLQTAPATLLTAGAEWRYFDQTNDLGSAWRSNSFSDGIWSNGRARLGFGGDGEVTKVASNRQWTTYFRRPFYVPNPTLVTTLNARLTRDDAAIIYLNGTEIWRDTNMPSGVITHQTPALTALGGTNEVTWLTQSLSPTNLVTGWNLLAAEVHQSALTSSDLGFDFELTGTAAYLEQPALTATLSSGNFTLSWPANAGFFTLCQVTNLTPPIHWSRTTNDPVLLNNQWTLTFPAPANSHRFYRLQTP